MTYIYIYIYIYEWLALKGGAVIARVLGDIIKDPPGSCHYLDDIVIVGISKAEQDTNQ